MRRISIDGVTLSILIYGFNSHQLVFPAAWTTAKRCALVSSSWSAAGSSALAVCSTWRASSAKTTCWWYRWVGRRPASSMTPCCWSSSSAAGSTAACRRAPTTANCTTAYRRRPSPGPCCSARWRKPRTITCTTWKITPNVRRHWNIFYWFCSWCLESSKSTVDPDAVIMFIINNTITQN